MNKHFCVLLYAILLATIPTANIKAQLSRFEYWFDDKQSGQSMAISGNEYTVIANLNTNGLKQGFHTLCYRAVQNDGSFSPVYSSSFLKFNASDASNLEYWFDDDFNKRSAVQLDVMSNEKMIMDLDMSNDYAFPYGFHELNMRIAAYGMQYSPVYSAYVMKVPKGKPAQITFWLDNDYSDRRVVSGNAEGIAVLANKLDLSYASPGIHHLKLRVRYSDGEDGAVYDEPILVKSQYNIQNPEIVAVQCWTDDERADEESTVASPASVYTHKVSLSPYDFSDGNHSFNIRYKNNAGVWTETNITYFNKQSIPVAKLWLDHSTTVEIVDTDEIQISTRKGLVLIHFSTEHIATKAIVQIFDSYGNILVMDRFESIPSNQLEIPIDTTNGVVLVRVTTSNETISRKVFIH